MNNKTYDAFKQIALVVIPALATFIGALGLIWEIPNTEPVVLTITAAGVFLGTILGISNSQYKKGRCGDYGTVDKTTNPEFYK